VVGLNQFVEEQEGPVEILKIGDQAEQSQRVRMAKLRATRDSAAVFFTCSKRCGSCAATRVNVRSTTPKSRSCTATAV